ncbi:hypothetical protein LE191_04105 [Janthinobacterium sp. HSC-3S05]|uniref:hypothetical protein n=1 Tax=Janthinobacterium lividum TaxID=29581 RepID=UPI001CD8921F|nr:hypothetical protein [Janthinobacterium lividum]MCA1859292.1 hypothetical protein [Janthinobacterium lividum]
MKKVIFHAVEKDSGLKLYGSINRALSRGNAEKIDWKDAVTEIEVKDSVLYEDLLQLIIENAANPTSNKKMYFVTA